MAIPETPGIANAVSELRQLLDRARTLKPSTEIEPPLSATEFAGEKGLPVPTGVPRTQYFSAIEYASRQVFQERVASVAIEDPEFVEIWNLFDILSVCGDQEQCDFALVWWLLEELLDAQSIDGCRIVFDYLEARRERLVSKYFDKKHLVILRAFNELLRRLSRAEEAVFCGRVFIFLFQSFPLGAKSSVNIRGEFHKENFTTFEETSTEPESEIKDETENDKDTNGATDAAAAPTAEEAASTNSQLLSTESGLYPAFWTMQQAFSNPPEYFFKQHRIEEFKTTLEATLAKFRQVPKINQAAADNRGTKRSAGEMEGSDEFATTFNPKYLTSRELFTLELSDLAFQRHILVQALIMLDFLLSLTEKVKKRSAGLSNKSVQYDYVLVGQDAEWVEKMRRAIASYLTDGQLGGDAEGKYYNRMVETVLSRDKNWVRWKAENCQEIKRLPVDSLAFNSAHDGVKRASMAARLKSAPMGALDLKFLKGHAPGEDTEMQDEMMRSTLPAPETLVRDVQNVDLDLEMAADDEERQSLEDAKMSKTWRALRLMSKTKLSLFDKVDDGRNLDCFIQPHGAATDNMEGGEMMEKGGDDDPQTRAEEGVESQ